MLMDIYVVPGFFSFSFFAIINNATLNTFCTCVLYKILSSGCGRSQGICIFDFTGSAKLGSKLVTPVFKAVEQRQGHVRSSSESFLSVGLMEK